MSIVLPCNSGFLTYSFVFTEMYALTGETLGSGAYASVQTCVSTLTDMQFAVKVSFLC